LISTEPSLPPSAFIGKRTSVSRLSITLTGGRFAVSSGSGMRWFSNGSASMTAKGMRRKVLLFVVLLSISSAGFCTRCTKTIAIAPRKRKKNAPTLYSGQMCQQMNWLT